MAVRRVLVLYQDSLLAQGILSLLREQAGVEARSGQFKDAPVEEFMRRFAPDVVIVDREDFAAHAAIALSELVAQASGIRVIDVSAASDMVRLYDGRRIDSARFEDVLAAIADNE